jgi:hypothetical protein
MLAEDIALAVVFEDEALIVIDKPAGLVVHPGNGNASGTLLNALLHHAPQLAGIPRAGIVHRLDKDTSGLLVVAKTLTAQTDLVRQMQARSVRRHYLALALGTVERDGTVDAPLGRHAVQRTKMAIVRAGGKEARTHYAVRLNASPEPPCSNAAWKPDARTRSASIWHRSSIRWPAIRYMASRKAATPASMLSRARRCMPGAGAAASGNGRGDGVGVALAGGLRAASGILACLNSSCPTGRRRPGCAPVYDARRRGERAAVARLQPRRPCRRRSAGGGGQSRRVAAPVAGRAACG